MAQQDTRVIKRYRTIHNPERFINDRPAIRIAPPNMHLLFEHLNMLVDYATSDKNDWPRWRFTSDRATEQRVHTPEFGAPPFNTDPAMRTRIQIVLPSSGPTNMATIEKVSQEDPDQIFEGQIMIWRPDTQVTALIYDQRDRSIPLYENDPAHQEILHNAASTLTAAVAEFCPNPAN